MAVKKSKENSKVLNKKNGKKDPVIDEKGDDQNEKNDQQIETKSDDKSEEKVEKKAPVEEELSEEDEQLKNDLELLVERLEENDATLYSPSLSSLKEIIRTSTSSMTAVPKPLKFLAPHYKNLVKRYEAWTDPATKAQFADVLSVLGMTYVDTEARDSLRFRLESKDTDIYSWGFEYVRHLALEVGQEYAGRLDSDTDVSSLVSLALKLIPFFMTHNAEADAVDLLMEVESVEKIKQFVDVNTYERVCLYMVSCINLLAPPDDQIFLKTAFEIYLAQKKVAHALILALRSDDEDLMRTAFSSTTDHLMHQQLALIVAKNHVYLPLIAEKYGVQDEMSNGDLSQRFRYAAEKLDLLEPKTPEDIYKTHLEANSSVPSNSSEVAKQSLASCFVNGLINCGFGTDRLLLGEYKGANSILYRTRDDGMLSATASIGMLFQWDFEDGLQALDRYLYTSEESIKSGAILAIGIVNKDIRDEADTALALLADYLSSTNVSIRTSAIIGLGIAYAGSQRGDICDLLTPLITDTTVPMQISACAAVSLGQIFVGSCNGDATSTLLQTLMERDATDLDDKWARFLALGLALIYAGKAEETDAVVEAVKVINHKLASIVSVLLTIVSYAGTGNVLKIQQMLHDCLDKIDDSEDEEDDSEEEDDDEEIDEEEEDEDEENVINETNSEFWHGVQATSTSGKAPSGQSKTEIDNETESAAQDTDDSDDETHLSSEEIKSRAIARQQYSVLGIAAIAMGEDIGQEMSYRHFGHLMRYGEANIRRAVPLALALLHASNPQMKVFETLSRYSHDSDIDVAFNAVFGMGIVGAGTNNARLSILLRHLASYYSREPNVLFMVRIAQGLVHLGKGTLTVNPFHFDRQVLSRVSLAGLMPVLVALLEPKLFILSGFHMLLYNLVLAIQPRFLITLDKDLKPLPVNVRVGQAVDVVGQAGRPKTITGWVTHVTPVLLNYGERAELEDDKYISLTPSLEGIVILRENPDYVEGDR